ncbi:GABRB3 [Branchiostoma lanceolatum]|uniref:Gamma-aminobutyric acid receptor subunit pi n=1 Tax=Branchiostoma lanceolatum TaxID=7740 RepID=A0A8K0A0T0_BRALA|nr:GABRB3 [Branchiostoma lanceolatum]
MTRDPSSVLSVSGYPHEHIMASTDASVLFLLLCFLYPYTSFQFTPVANYTTTEWNPQPIPNNYLATLYTPSWVPNMKKKLVNYNRNLRPGFGGPPLLVKMSLDVVSIDHISAVDLDFTICILLRQYWKDERLAFTGTNESISLDGRLVEYLWVPDTFFPNSKFSFLHNVTMANRLLRLWPDGSIVYGQRVTVIAECNMDLRKYPLDKQNCSLHLESYGYTTDDMIYKWLKGDDSVRGLQNLQVAQFRVKNHRTKEMIVTYETGAYPHVAFSFRLTREVAYIFLQMYVPSTLLVMISWVSFWINKDSPPARVSLGITTVLAQTTFVTSARASLPKISYIKAVDVYLLMCFFFVFAALGEYAIVSFESTRRKRKAAKKEKEIQTQREREIAQRAAFVDQIFQVHPDEKLPELQMTSTEPEEEQSWSTKEGSSSGISEETKARRMARIRAKVARIQKVSLHDIEDVDNIDRYSRIIFPSTFVFCAVLYWTVYLLKM